MEDNVVCKAKIKSMCLVLVIVYVILFGLANFITFETKSYTEYEQDDVATLRNAMNKKPEIVYRYDKPPKYKEDRYLLWWKQIAKKTYAVREDIKNREEGISFETDYMLILAGIMIIPPLLFILLFKNKSKNSSLELTDKEINGIHKKMLSTEDINLPIDKVETATVKKNVYNILTGGKTVVICTSSGNYKFPWVQNAEEFAQAVRQKIDENKNK